MREVSANQVVKVQSVSGGERLTVSGDRPPIGALLMLLIFTLMLAGIFALAKPALGFLIFLLGAGAIAFIINKSVRSQFVEIANGKISNHKKSFDLKDVSEVILSNAQTERPLARNRVAFIAGGEGAAGGVLLAGTGAIASMAAVSGAMQDVSRASNMKKAYYIAIEYGSKKYVLAWALREIKAKRLYEAICQRVC